jgi:phage minor structural protein
MADLIIKNISGKTEFLTDYQNLKRKKRVNGENSLSFLLYKTVRNEHSFDLAQEESLIELDGQKYRIKKVQRRTIGETIVKQIEAHHVLFDLIDNRIYNILTGVKTLQEALTFAFSGSNFTFSVIDTFANTDLGEFGDNNSLALLNKICDLFGAEVEENNTHLNFRKQIGVDAGVQIRRGYNLKTLQESVDTSNLSTYIKGFGKQNEDGSYVVETDYTSPNSAVFGIRHADPVRDERYTTLIGLKERLKKDIRDIPEVSITVSFVDLKKAGYTFETISKGDVVYVIDEILGIDYPARVLEIEDHPEVTDPSGMTITITNYRKDITDFQADFEQVRKQIRNTIDDNGVIRYNFLPAATKVATESLTNAATELEFPEDGGIIGRSKYNSNHLTVFNSNGFGISRDGGQSFQEAITADGFVLSVGAIGKLNANNIDISGTIVAINSEGSTLIDGGKILLASNPDFTGKTTYIDSNGVYTGTIEAVTGDFRGNLASSEVQVRGYSNGFVSNILMETGGTSGIRMKAYGPTGNPNFYIGKSTKGVLSDETRFNEFKVHADDSRFTKDVYVAEDLTVGYSATIFGALSSYGISTNGFSIQSNGGHIQAGSGGLYGGFASISGSMSSGSVYSGYGSFTSLESSGTTRSRGYYPDGNGDSSFVYLVSSNGVRCATSFAGTSYVPIQASNVGTSKIDTKTDIEPFDGIAMEVIRSTPFFGYYLKNEVEELDELGNPTGVRKENHGAVKKTGTMLHLAPVEIAEPQFEMINLYSMASISWIAHQETDVRLIELEQELKQKSELILDLENRLAVIEEAMNNI